MANTKISQLTANTNPNGGEELVYAYNNANGKMSLNTMKTFVQPDLSNYVTQSDLSGYATTSDLTTGLAGKQDTLVSGTNIRTINGASVMGSGDIIVTGGTGYTAGTGIDITGGVISATGGGGAGGYDCVVDANGGGDYTTINAALDAGKKSIYVKQGSYTESTWDCTSKNVTIVGEMGATVNFSSLTSTGDTSYAIRISAGYDYYIQGLNFVVTSGASMFSSYTNASYANIFRVVDCKFTISTMTKFMTGWLDVKTDPRTGLYSDSTSGINGFYGCIITTTSSTLQLSSTTGSHGQVPYIRCVITGTSTDFTGKRAVFEHCVINVSSLQNDLLGTGNTYTVVSKYSGNTALVIKFLYDSWINLDSTFTDKVTIEDCDNIKLYNGKPSEIDISGQLTGSRIDIDDVATVVKCKGFICSGNYFELANNSTFTVDGCDVFTGNNVDTLAGTTINISESKDCSGNVLAGVINIGKNGTPTFVSFCNNAVWGSGACTIYCPNGIIVGNKFGTESYSKPVTFESGAIRNTFTGNYLYSMAIQSGADYNIILGNILYSGTSISDSGTGNIKEHNII